MSNLHLYDDRGRPVPLGAKIGAGGEGSVFEIAGSPGLAAKVYDERPPAGRADKLRAMIRLAGDELRDVAAWPEATLHDRPGGAVRGLVMRKVQDFKEAHALYNPADRKAEFPHADWAFLVHAAKNCAAAFDALHGCGVVVGDVNGRNVLVSPQGLVALIDCDSFQVRLNGHTYVCEVGTLPFTPPELQGRAFRGVVRDVNHDRFGLAVLIFHLLFMGRHPFAGRYLGQGDMPLERAIKEYRFAYGGAARTYQMSPPRHALPPSALSPQLAGLFGRAFGRDSARPNARPAASEWHTALTAFRGALRPCPSDGGHVYPSHLGGCPWCDLIRQGAPNFFVSVAYFRATGSRPGTGFDLAAVWARVERVPRPGGVPARPAAAPAASPTPWPPGLPKAVPPRPVAPAILTSPPTPPPISLPAPKHQRVSVPPDSTQRAVGAWAVVPCVGFLFLLLLGCPWWKFFVAAAVIAFLIPGAWWLVLERGRRRKEHEVNREYEEELAQRQAEARRQREAWGRDLAARQAEAKQRYDEEVRRWEGVVASLRAEAGRRRRGVDEARRRAAATGQGRASAAAGFADQFDKKKADLQQLRGRHNNLATQYADERQRLLVTARGAQFNQYLRQQFIRERQTRGLGPARIGVLASRGIKTAFDIEEGKVGRVPRLPREVKEGLLGWRRDVESRFVFAGIPPHEQQALDTRYAQARQPIEAALLAGAKALEDISVRAETALRALDGQVRSCVDQVNQATADLAVVPPGL